MLFSLWYYSSILCSHNKSKKIYLRTGTIKRMFKKGNYFSFIFPPSWSSLSIVWQHSSHRFETFSVWLLVNVSSYWRYSELSWASCAVWDNEHLTLHQLRDSGARCLEASYVPGNCASLSLQSQQSLSPTSFFRLVWWSLRQSIFLWRSQFPSSLWLNKEHLLSTHCCWAPRPVLELDCCDGLLSLWMHSTSEVYCLQTQVGSPDRMVVIVLVLLRPSSCFHSGCSHLYPSQQCYPALSNCCQMFARC